MMEQTEAEASSTPEEGVQLNRNRSIKSKLLVRSQAIRESQSPPRTVSPSYRSDNPDKPLSPDIGYAQERHAGGTDPKERLQSNNFEERIQSDSKKEPLIKSNESNASSGEKERLCEKDSSSDWTEVRKSCSDSQVSSHVSDSDKRQIQQVEIQITSGTWDSEHDDHSSRSVRSRHWLTTTTSENNAGLLSNNPRMMCVCGGCDRREEKRRNTGVCPECRGKRRPHALCTTKQDSGIGYPDCPDSPEAPPSGESPDQSRTRRKTSESADEPHTCRCLDRKERPKIGSLPRTDSEEKNELSGAELVMFVRKTLNQSVRDRATLLRIERELIALVNDNGRCVVRFPPVAAYGRMLIHRCAALFQLKHTIEQPNKNVVLVSKTGTSGGRIPCTSFRQWCTAAFPPSQHPQEHTPAKYILKRDAHSLDEASANAAANSANMRSKSFEQREEEYERVRRRIFSSEDCQNRDEESQWPWLNAGPIKLLTPDPAGKQNRLLKVQSLEGQPGPASRGPVSKSHSFGGYGRDEQHQPRILSRQGDLASSSWRLSPSSSGYKTLSLHSVDSVTPSPTGGVSPEPGDGGALVWAVTDLSSVPPGALIIHPQTGRPLTNADGSVYHYDPARPPVVPGADAATLTQTNSENKTDQNADKKRGRLEKQNSFIDPDCDCQSKSYQPQNCCGCCETKTQLDWSYQCDHTNITAEPVCPSGTQTQPKYPKSQDFYLQTPEINEKVTSTLKNQPENTTSLIVPKLDATSHNLDTTNHGLASTNHSLASTNHSLASTNHNLASTNHSLASTNHSLASTNHSLASTNHSLASTNHSVASTNHNYTNATHNYTPTNHRVPPTNRIADTTNQMKHAPTNHQLGHEFKQANQIEDESSNEKRPEDYHQYEYGSNVNSNMVHYPLTCYGSQSFRVEDEPHVHPQAVGSPGFGQDGHIPWSVQHKPPYDASMRAHMALGALLYPNNVNATAYPYTNHCRMDQPLQQPFYHQITQEEPKTTPSPQLEPATYPLEASYFPAQPIVTPEIQNGVLIQNGAPYQSYVAGGAGYAQQMAPFSHNLSCAGACGVDPVTGIFHCLAPGQRSFGVTYGQTLEQPSLVHGAAYQLPNVLLPQPSTAPAAVHPYQFTTPNQWPWSPLLSTVQNCPAPVQKSTTPPVFIQPDMQYIHKLDYPSVYPVMFNNYGYPQTYIPQLGYPLYHPVYQSTQSELQRRNSLQSLQNSLKVNAVKMKCGSGGNSSRTTPLNVGYATPIQQEQKSPIYPTVPYEIKFDNKETNSPTRTRLLKQSSFDQSQYDKRKLLRTNSARSTTDHAARQDSSNSTELAAKIQQIKDHMSTLNVTAAEKAARTSERKHAVDTPTFERNNSGSILGNYPTANAQFGGRMLGNSGSFINDSTQLSSAAQAIVNSIRSRHCGSQPANFYQDSRNRYPGNPPHNQRTMSYHYRQNDHNMTTPNHRPDQYQPRNYRTDNHLRRPYQNYEGTDRIDNNQKLLERFQNPQEIAQNIVPNAQEIVENLQENAQDFQNQVPEGGSQENTHRTEIHSDRSENPQERVQNLQENVQGTQESTQEHSQKPQDCSQTTDNERNSDSVQSQHNPQERSQNEQERYQSTQEWYQSARERDQDSRRNQRFDGRSQDMRADGQYLQRHRSFNQMVPYQFGRPYMFRQMSAGSWCRRSPGPAVPAGFNPRCGPRRPAPDTRRR